MSRKSFITDTRWQQVKRTSLALYVMAGLAGLAASAVAQVPSAARPDALRTDGVRVDDVRSIGQAFQAAWARQPEALALAARRDAVRAQQQSTQTWTPEPAALELATKSDRFLRNLGTREYEAGVSVPLWLPGERSRSQALAQAEGRALESRTTAAQLRVAAAVREAWWNWQRARSDSRSASAQLDNARRIADDVAKRLKAGDLARADQHQADGAAAAAEAAVAQAHAATTAALQHLRGLTASPAGATGAISGPAGAKVVAGSGSSGSGSASTVAGAETGAEANPGVQGEDVDSHSELLALKDRAAVASSTVALAATQSRANPELTVSTTRDRGVAGERYQQSFTVGVRIPFGAGPRQEARTAAAKAEVIELQAQLALERSRVVSEREAAQARTEAARAQVAAADRRALLARETRGFFDKSFRLGETDLPTLLRIEAEAAEAERQAGRAQIELAAAISGWRQALGLLPQ